ncbi:MAG: BlaI/MecI/CopY family transcriptional regulator [Phycisphaerales bacterium]|nr:BlaI/MecI/CopY family transcriptional regulator [Phycisphaerales bacterium]
MACRRLPPLSRREREILEILYALGPATAGQIGEALADPLSNSAVRTFLRIMEEKGHLAHREELGKYVYFPTTPREVAARSALKRLLATFFSGSLESAVLAHLSDPDTKLSSEELARFRGLIKPSGMQAPPTCRLNKRRTT